MHDPRIDRLADILLDHSCELKPGERVLIEAFDLPEPVLVCRLVEGAAKRGGNRWRVTLSEGDIAAAPRDVGLLDLDAALQKLSAADPRLGDLVVLRFFGGLTVEEAAEVQDTSSATVKRDWLRARAWLYRELRPAARPR